LASQYDYKEVIQLLIEKGIDIIQTNKEVENALHLASIEGLKEVVQLLFEK
jgi:ankyrin repeat protein